MFVMIFNMIYLKLNKSVYMQMHMHFKIKNNITDRIFKNCLKSALHVCSFSQWVSIRIQSGNAYSENLI